MMKRAYFEDYLSVEEKMGFRTKPTGRHPAQFDQIGSFAENPARFRGNGAASRHNGEWAISSNIREADVPRNDWPGSGILMVKFVFIDSLTTGFHRGIRWS